MSDENLRVAADFWKSRVDYPEYPFLKERRLVEVSYLLKNIPSDATSLADFGCGDGSNLLLLRELSYVTVLYGYDLSESLISVAQKKLGDSAVLKNIDFLQSDALPEVDVALSLGVLPYLFTEDALTKYLNLIQCKRLIVRTPCALDQNVVINKYSQELGADYAAIYRTVSEVEAILSSRFVLRSTERSYPNNIESKYGTKQYYFVCDAK